MEYEGIIQGIGNFGFPIIITIYLLLRFENKLNELTEAIVNLREFIKVNKE